MPNPNEMPIEQPTTLIISTEPENPDKNRKRIFILLGIFLAIIVLLVIILLSGPSCQANPKINQTHLDIMNKTQNELSGFCKTASDELSCTAKYYYTYTNAGNIPSSQRVWLFKESDETIQGMIFKGNTEHICAWR